MPLRAKLRASPELVQDLELAAEEKYLEGLELLLQQKLAGGIYMMGYSAEMILKTACFRIDGARPNSSIAGMNASCVAWMKAHYSYVTLKPESYHSVLFWSQTIICKRHHAGKPFAPAFERDLLSNAQLLYDDWWVDMRYRPDQATTLDATMIREAAEWMRVHSYELWR